MTSFVGSLSETYPYSAIVFLRVTYENGKSYVGSGAMVGPNDILTASHVVYNQERGVASRVKVHLGSDGAARPFGTIEAERWDYLPVGTGNGYLFRSQSRDDVAVIGTAEPIGERTGWFELDPDAVSGTYTLTSYPGGYADELGPRMVSDTDSVAADPNYSVWNYTDVDTSPGSSGGPLWYQGADGPAIVGVHSTGAWAANIALRHDQIHAWIGANDELMGDRVAARAEIAGTAGDDVLTAAAGGSVLRSLDGRDQLAGADGDDIIYGNRNADSLSGGAGDDTLYGAQNDGPADSTGLWRAGAETIAGGAGTDTVVYSLARDSYAIAALDDGRLTVDGTDRLTDVEFIAFADQTVATAGLVQDGLGLGTKRTGAAPCGPGSRVRCGRRVRPGPGSARHSC